MRDESDNTIEQLKALIEEFKKALRESTFETLLEKRALQAVLGQPASCPDCPQVFVSMPYVKELSPVYDDHIKEVARQLGLTIGTAKDIFPHGQIMSAVWAGIHAADVVIADCTGCNSNVMYEIGLSHAIGKTTILISQSIADVPSDFRHFKVIDYQFTPRGMAKFQLELKESILHARRRDKGGAE